MTRIHWSISSRYHIRVALLLIVHGEKHTTQLLLLQLFFLLLLLLSFLFGSFPLPFLSFVLKFPSIDSFQKVLFFQKGTLGFGMFFEGGRQALGCLEGFPIMGRFGNGRYLARVIHFLE